MRRGPAEAGQAANDYIRNKNSMKFHYPTCRAVSQMSEKNKVEFFSREEAVERGYKPCGECNP